MHQNFLFKFHQVFLGRSWWKATFIYSTGSDMFFERPVEILLAVEGKGPGQSIFQMAATYNALFFSMSPNLFSGVGLTFFFLQYHCLSIFHHVWLVGQSIGST